METESLGFWVYGRVVGKARPRVTRNGRFTPKSTVEAEARVAAAARAALPEGAGQPLFGRRQPVAVGVTVWRPLPGSRPKRVEAEPDTYTPDVDNVAKLVMDAMQGVVLEDDAQVTTLYVAKMDRARGVDECMYVSVRPNGGSNE